jgi:hypothetical protein
MQASILPRCTGCNETFSMDLASDNVPIVSKVCGHTSCKRCILALEEESQFYKCLLVCKACTATQQSFPTEDFPGSENFMLIDVMSEIRAIAYKMTGTSSYSGSQYGFNPANNRLSESSFSLGMGQFSTFKKSAKMDEEINPSKSKRADTWLMYN